MSTLSTSPGAQSPAPDRSEPILRVRDLTVEFATGDRVVQAVNGVDFDLGRGESLGILGESGSGKSVTAKAIMQLLDTPPARVVAGSATLAGVDLLAMDEATRRRTVGSRISMVFQDALSALNPVHTVGKQVAEMFRVHRKMSRSAARAEAIQMMERVRIPEAAHRFDDYPHQFSGGMRQRIVLAMALALDPEVLIADEPTTALDVTVQAQILELLAEQRRALEMGLILITHDISVVSESTTQVGVMYAGRIVERGPTTQVLQQPAHPYTIGLAASIGGAVEGNRLPAIPGSPPDLAHLPDGCPFAARCQWATAICRTERPVLRTIAPGHEAACHHVEEVLAR